VFNQFDEKKLLIEENERRLLHFYLSDDNEHNCNPHSRVPGRLFSGHVIAYDRKRIPIQQHTVDIISKEGEASHFIWRTSPKNITQAIDDGLISFDALTAKVRQALGGYMKVTRKRLYQSGIISKKFKEKYALLRFAQSRIKALEPLERLMNNANPALTPNENLTILKRALSEYRDALLTHQEKISERYGFLSYFDKCVIDSIHNDLQKDIDRLDTFLNSLDEKNLQAYFQGYGTKSLGAFIKEQMIRQLREVQALNQNLIYSRRSGSVFRGDFNGVVEDALREINIHHADLHNPVLKEHQGIFPESKKDYAIDFQFLGKDQRAIEATFMGIAQIEGEDKLIEADGDFILLKKEGSRYRLKSTNKTKWAINESATFTALRVGAWFWNVSSGILLGLTFDLFIGLAVGLFGYKPPSLASQFQISLRVGASKHTFFSKLIKTMRPPTYSLGTLVGFKLSNFVRNIVGDLINGVTTTIKQFKFELWENLRVDYLVGHHGHNKEKTILETFESELKFLRDEKEKAFEHINASLPRFRTQKEHQLTAQPAVPPYHLSHGEWLDIFNEAIHGARFVAETFTHSIHSKHPLAGLIFSSSYLSGLFVILAPHFMSFMPSGYLSFTHTLANAMSKGGLTKAIASGMTQAQLFTGAFNALIEGNESWLFQGGQLFEKNPSNILVYITLAVGLGALIAFELDIPYISEKLRDDLGNIPIPSLGFAGAKIGILLVDLLEEKKPEAIQERIPLIISQLDSIIKKFTNIKDKETREKIIQTLLSDDFLQQVKKKSYQIKKDLTEKHQEELKKVAFLFKLEKEKDLLPKLSTKLKRELLHSAKEYFPEHTQTLGAIHNLLYPPPPQSIFIITVTTVIYYIPLLIRAALFVVTWNPAPFTDLQIKVQKDLTRVAVGLSNAFHGLASFFKATFRGIFDILGNEVVARAASAAQDNDHPISGSTYGISSRLDVQFEHFSQRLSEPVEYFKKDSTFSTPYHVFKQESQYFFEKTKDVLEKPEAAEARIEEKPLFNGLMQVNPFSPP
jgi:hypothetical protein